MVNMNSVSATSASALVDEQAIVNPSAASEGAGIAKGAASARAYDNLPLDSDTAADSTENQGNGLLGSSSRQNRLDQFHILRVLGSGAFGKVYLAHHRPTGSLFAIKSMKKEALIRSGGPAQARVERDILALLMDHVCEPDSALPRSPNRNIGCTSEQASSHPFIVRLHCAFQTASRVFLVMDYLRGGPLMDYMRREALFSEEVARFYAAEMLIALQHLHSMGIVHRDLKPENVLLDQDGHVALTDFGLSKAGMGRPETVSAASVMSQAAEAALNRCDDLFATEKFSEDLPFKLGCSGQRMQHADDSTLGSDATTCLTHSWCGTEHYMAPELLAREGHSFAADYWSYGCLIYEMLTGEPPFSVRAQGLCGKGGRRRRKPNLAPAGVPPQAASEVPTEKAPRENVFSREALYKRILKAKVKFPHYISTEAQSLVRQLLCRSPDERLRNALCLRHHRWFRSVSWRRVRERLERPPIAPEMNEISVEGTVTLSTPIPTASLNISPHTPPCIQTNALADTYLVAFTYVAPHALHAFGDYLSVRNGRPCAEPFCADHQLAHSSSASSVSEPSSARVYARNIDSDGEHAERDFVDAMAEMRVAVSEGIEIFSIDGAECWRSTN
jgi:serine/threonine protein kinase